MKKLVEGIAEVQETGSFKLNKQHSFENVPPLYAAMISSQDSIWFTIFFQRTQNWLSTLIIQTV
jgi:hypothetical protein